MMLRNRWAATALACDPPGTGGEETEMTTPGNNGDGGTGEGGAGPGTGQNVSTPPAGSGGTGTVTQPPDEWADRDTWKSLADELGMTPAQIKDKLGHARTWEQRAKDNRSAAEKAADLETQVEQMRQAQTDRDAKDVERSKRMATTELRAKLVGLGMEEADARDALELVDSARLIKDGEPDEKAIDTAARKLAKVAGRATPDRDQGQGNGNGQSAPATMDDWVRTQVANRRR